MKDVLLKLDDEIYSQLKSVAEKNERAVTQQVRYFIKKGLEDE